jgi:N-acetylglucosaminyldiphosphoundecaprenol N-acetyl-beta-D-mannosaminyltransferase
MSVTFTIDNYVLSDFIVVASRFRDLNYAYVVTPNVDHVIRYVDDPSFRSLYETADFVMLDSRFLAKILLLARALRLEACPGSDITARLFNDVITPDDKVVMIGGASEQANVVAQRYGLRQLLHYNPPMGFITNPAAVEDCLKFVEQASPFRFCFLAIGSPQQEVIAQKLKQRGIAKGLTLCVGASINFLTGRETRAPLWLQNLGFEWLYRLMRDPGRLASRYLVRGPRIFLLLNRITFVCRKPQTQGLEV